MLTKRLLIAIGLASSIATGLHAGQPQEGTKAADKLNTIIKNHQDAEAAFRKEVETLENSPDGQKKFDELWKEFDRGQSDRFAAAVEIAQAYPNSDTAIVALEWVLTKPRSHYLRAGVLAMEEVTKHHSANPKVGKLVARVGYLPPHESEHPKEAAAVWAMIEAIVKNNPDKTTRAQAVLAKALKAKSSFDLADFRNQPDTEKLAIAAEDAFEVLIKEYGDCPRLLREKSGTIGEFAKQELYELRNLRIGKVAPEIDAEGVDGKKFKLSDYRGKVVVVIFWESTCGPCMAEVPHQREMTERLKGKPFTIVAINGDKDRDQAAELIAKQKMTWPTFWNYSGGSENPITKAWNVRAWPTIYVLDSKGVIRFKHFSGKALEEKVNELLAEIDMKK